MVDARRGKQFVFAEEEIIKSIQVRHFAEERRELVKRDISSPDGNKELTKKKYKLTPHNPFIDEDGFMRVGSRLKLAPLEFEVKYPILLPKKEENVRYLIHHIHAIEGHAGSKHVHSQLRQRFWILQGLQFVKSEVEKCVDCQKRRKAPCSQKMAPLPQERTDIGANPFSVMGIDCMGPFLCKQNGSRANQKIWVLIFTCFSSRAVHAECLINMTASSVVNAIAKFAARRPGVRKIYSDQAGNFTKARKLLISEFNKCKKDAILQLEMRGIHWELIPPYAPHHGGVWERVVVLFKKHLLSFNAKEVLHYDLFHTIVTEAEGILNRRPLYAESSDSRDPKAITPNHLIAPASVDAPLEPIVNWATKDVDAGRNLWIKSQNRISKFWRSFRKDYLSLLHQRAKWRTTKQNLAVGDLVIITDDTIARNDWRMGRVEKIHLTGSHVRRVDIRRGDGKILPRDRSKIVKLEME